MRLLLPTSVFALKFLEWWHASDFSRQLSRKVAEGLDLPPPVVSGLGLVRKQQEERKKRGDGEEKLEEKNGAVTPNKGAKRKPPISSLSYLPILTVPPPPSSDLCPICLHPIETAAACQTGFVYDYKCIFQWIEGTHERQETFMKGEKMSEWEDEEEEEEEEETRASEGDATENKQKIRTSREGQWENGHGRCAVTGRRVLGGTSGLRRIMV